MNPVDPWFTPFLSDPAAVSRNCKTKFVGYGAAYTLAVIVEFHRQQQRFPRFLEIHRILGYACRRHTSIALKTLRYEGYIACADPKLQVLSVLKSPYVTPRNAVFVEVMKDLEKRL